MLEKVKQYYWVILIGIGILLALIFSPNREVIEELKSLLRKKKVEDDVNKLQDMLKVPEAERQQSEQKLIELAEKLKEDKKNVKKMSVEEVQDFYKRMLK